MERVRTVTGGARLVAAAALAAAVAPAVGCVSPKSFESMQQSLKEAVAPAKPKPAAEFACTWQTRLSLLADPTRGGAMRPGLVGQIFLYTAAPEYKPADVAGDLTVTVAVADQASRAAVMPAPQPEVWHFTKDVLKKMVVADERFGRSVAVFLPWPDTWRDVTRVSIQARFDQTGNPTLYSQPTGVTLDLSPGSVRPGQSSLPSVPDPAAVIQQMRASAMPPTAAQPQAGAVMQPGYPQPSMAPAGPPAYTGWAPSPPGVYTQQMPVNSQGVQYAYPPPNALPQPGVTPAGLVMPQMR
jgi:hypothetical protein